MIPRKALNNVIYSCAITPAITPGIKPGGSLLAVATVSFDMSVLDIYLPIVSGASAIIMSQEGLRDPFMINEYAGDVCLVRSLDNEYSIGEFYPDHLGLDRLTKGKLVIHKCIGTHLGILEKTYENKTSDIVNRYIIEHEQCHD